MSRVLTANTNTPLCAREELILIRKWPGTWSLRRFAASVSSMLPANQLEIQGKDVEQEKGKGRGPLFLDIVEERGASPVSQPPPAR